MDPISALSLACCVMQVVSFAQETASIGIRIYRTGELEPGLEQKSASLKELYEDLASGLKRWNGSTNGKGHTDADSSLGKVAKKTLGTASELRQEVDKIAQERGKVWASLKMVALAQGVKRKRKIEKLESKMKEYQTLLENRLLMKIW